MSVDLQCYRRNKLNIIYQKSMGLIKSVWVCSWEMGVRELSWITSLFNIGCKSTPRYWRIRPIVEPRIEEENVVLVKGNNGPSLNLRVM